MGDMDIRGGIALVIKELPGELKRNGEFSHAVNPQSFFGIGDKIDFGIVGFCLVREAFCLQECEFQQVNFEFNE